MLIEQPTTPNKNGAIILLFLVALLFAVLYFALDTQLDLSQHALEERADTSLNATTILSMIQNKTCRPVETYECPAVEQRKIICNLGQGGIWAGLIIGTSVDPPVVITGYPAPYKYWMGTVARDGCYLTIYSP